MELLSNDNVSIVYALKYEMVRIQDVEKKIPKGTAYIIQSYFGTLLRCVLSVTFCWAAVLKVIMDQKALVTRG